MSPNGNPDNQSCAMCLYWQPATVYGLESGNCRRLSPVVSVVGGLRSSHFPVTKRDQWCGEFSWGGREAGGR